MTAVSTLLTQTRNDYLTPSASEARNKLDGAVDASTETLTFARPLGGIVSGSKLSINLEDFYVWSTTDSSKTADVDRGEFGSTAAAHADNDVVLVDPKYTNAQILRALNAGVSMLASEGLFATNEVEITHLTSVNGYDLTGSENVLGLLDVMWESTNSTAKQWSHLPNVRFMPNANVADFASGTAVFIDSWAPPNGAQIRIRYKYELTAGLAALDDVVETVTGLESDAMDLLCIAAALHLTAGKEIALNETDAARPRRAREVPPGSFSQADSNLRTLYRDRVKAERRRLRDKHQTMRIRGY